MSFGRATARALLVAGVLLLAPATLFAQAPAGAGNVCVWDFLRPTQAEGSGPNGVLTPLEAERTLVDNLAHVCTALVAEDLPTACADGQVLEALSGGLVCAAGGGGGGSLTLEEVDGAPTGTASTLRLDQADGFVLTDETGGTFRLDLAAVPLSALAEDVLTEAELSSEAQLEAQIGVGVVTPAEDQDDQAAAEVPITDAGGLYTATDVEAALQETPPGARTPTAHAASHQDAGGDELSVAGLSGQLADAQTVTVESAGTPVGTRPRLNLIEGSNVTLAIADDAADDEIDVTISAASTGGTVVAREVDGAPSVTASTLEFDQSTGLTVTDQGAGIARVSSTGAGGDPWAGQYHPDREPAACTSCEDFAGGAEALTWRWGNEDVTTLTLELDGATLAVPAAENDEYHGRWTDAPASGDWVASARFTGHFQTVNDQCGLWALHTGTEATPTDVKFAGQYKAAAAAHRAVWLAGGYTSPTFGSELTLTADPLVLEPLYLQLRHDDAGNTLTYYISREGRLWHQVTQWTGLTAAPASVGVYARAATAATDLRCHVHWFRVRTDAAGLAGEVGE